MILLRLAGVGLLVTLSGCYAGLAGMVAGFVAVSDSGGGGSGDQPPTVAFAGPPEFLASPDGSRSPDRISVKFNLRNEDEGKLSARVEVLQVVANNTVNLGPAVSLPGSDSLGNVPNGNTVTFLWDVKQNLGEDSAMVQLLVTPVEDGKKGTPEPSFAFRAGNTPLEIQNLEVTSNPPTVKVFFELVDGESDEVEVAETTLAVKIGLAGRELANLPLDIVEGRLPSSPSGAQGRISFTVTDLVEHPEVPEDLEALGKPGFYGHPRIQVSARDYPEEAWSPPLTADVLFDNNEVPTAVIVAAETATPASRILPVRYRLLDLERNPADVLVEVLLEDGRRFLANEFPRAPSEGRRGLCSLDSLDPGSAAGCGGAGEATVHTFLWDALSQLPFETVENVVLQIRAQDLERVHGPPASRTIGAITRSAGLEPLQDFAVGDGPTAVMAGDFDGDGTDDVVVANKAEDTVTFFHGAPGGLERRGHWTVHYATAVEGARSPVALGRGDVDGDGIVDLVVANESSNTVTLFRGTREGIEECTDEVEVGRKPVALTCGDVDGDGLVDIVVASQTSRSVTVLRRVGGELESRVPVEVSGRPQALLGGDYDDDELSDIVVITQNPNTVVLLRGSGTTESGLVATPAIDVGGSPEALTSGDHNADGFLDVVVITQNPDSVVFLRGTDGRLEQSEGDTVEVGGRPVAAISVDQDQDGFEDVVVANLLSGEVLYLGGSSAGLEPPRSIVAGNRPRALTSGDYDGDGFPDVAVANMFSADVSYLRGTREGPVRAEEIPLGNEAVPVISPVAAASGDYDGDGLPDVAVVNRDSDNMTHLRGSSGGLVSAGRLPLVMADENPSSPFPRALTSGDVDGDGFLDVTAAVFPNGVNYFRGGSDGLELADRVFVRRPGTLCSCDYDADGTMDVLALSNSSNLLTFLRWDQGRLVIADEINGGEGGPIALSCGDYDDDGRVEIVVADSLSNTVRLIRWTEDGPEIVGEDVEVGAGPGALASGDFDGDGRTEILVASEGADSVTLLRVGDGQEGLVIAGVTTVGDGPFAFTTGDYDGNGVLDAVVASLANVAYLYWVEGRLVAEFLEVGGSPRALASGDYDGDGLLDVAVAHGAGRVKQLGGTPSGLVVRPGDIPGGGEPLALASGDYQGDGLCDVLVANAGEDSGHLTLLTGSGGGLRFGGRVTVPNPGLAPDAALVGGDFDGDGFSDVVAAYDTSHDLNFLRQLFLQPHENELFDPEAPDTFRRTLIEPRSPPRYRLELPSAPFAVETQVCLTVGSSFPLPQGKVFKECKVLINVTRAVALSHEETMLGGANGATHLTVRVREEMLQEVLAAPERLRVVRKNPQTGEGEINALSTDGIERIDFAGGTGVRFPIQSFGGYTVALELDRECR